MTPGCGMQVSGYGPCAKPFLKWAGGKRQLLPVLRTFYPNEFNSYFEPFVGSGAVFFDLHSAGRLRQRQVTLLDNNPDLIACYRALRENVDAVVEHLRRFDTAHRKDPERHYYFIREDGFNRKRSRLRPAGRPGIVDYAPELAAALIYLNRTCYNGLFRLNARGDFNVPLGRYANPSICDEPTLRSVAAALSSPCLSVDHGEFEQMLELARPGDFLYFDPPYAPLSATAVFTSYTADGFGDDDQRRLQRVVIELAGRGCHVVLSNSTAPMITELYEGRSAKRVGLRAFRVPAKRAINSNASKRGEVLEYVISNVDPKADPEGPPYMTHRRPART